MDSGVQHHRGRRGPHHWLPPSCLALVAAVTLAGCGAHARHSQAAPPSKATPTVTQARFGEADWYCPNARERSAMFPLDGPGHERLAALSIGTGRVAVILAHSQAARCVNGGRTHDRSPPVSGSSPSTSTDPGRARQAVVTTRAKSWPRAGGHAITVPGRLS